MNIAMILSGGVGKRFGKPTPKQYNNICGRPIISYVIDVVKKAKKIDKIIVVCAEEYQEGIEKTYGVETAICGQERNVSFRNGLEYIKSKYECEKVIVLDAVRPFVPDDLIDRYMDKLDEYEVVATCKSITDSLQCVDTLTCDRSRYFLMQSPEAFRFDLVDRYLDENSPLVEVYQQMPQGTSLYANYDFPDNYKLTYYQDLDFMEMLMEYKNKKK